MGRKHRKHRHSPPGHAMNPQTPTNTQSTPPSPVSAPEIKTGKQSTQTMDKLRHNAMDIFRAQDAASKRILAKGFSKLETTDGFDNFVSRVGLNNSNTLSASTYEFNLITRNRILLEAAYRGSWIVGNIVDAWADDMTRAGIDITTSETHRIKKLQKAMVKGKVWWSLNFLAKLGRLYGGALGVHQIEGQDMSTPLDIKTIGKGQYKGIVVYDRWQLNPVLTPVIESGPEMGLPKYYQIVTGWTSNDPKNMTPTGQVTVHHSRCIRYTGIDLPYFQAITEMMWGESVLERLWDRLIAFDNATMSAANLIERANNRTIGIEGFREIIGAGGDAYNGLLKMFDMIREFQTNEGLTLLDKNDTHETTAYTFTGLPEIVLQFGQQLSGASGIPLVRLFGQSPAGLSATGDSDIRMYYDSINASQETKYRDPMEILLRIMWRSTFGEAAPEDLEFEFTALWQMSETDKANNAKTTTETVIGAFEAGLTRKSTAMTELRASSSNTGLFANITDEDVEEAEDEEENPPLPDMPSIEPQPAKTALPTKPVEEEKPSKVGDRKGWFGGIFRRASPKVEIDVSSQDRGRFKMPDGATMTGLQLREAAAAAAMFLFMVFPR